MTLYYKNKDGSISTNNVDEKDVKAIDFYKKQGWSTVSPNLVNSPAVDNFLGNVATKAKEKIAGTSDKDMMTPEQKKQIDDWNKQIDGLDLTFEEKTILKEMLKGDYTSGAYMPNDKEIAQIIQDAATNAEVDLSPYYQTLTQRETEDIKANLADIRAKAANYEKQESLSYAQKLATTKQNLRARGLTFAGTSLKTLGSQSALKNETGIEGTMPTERRLGYEEQIQSWQEQARKLSTPAERRLGSSTFGTINLGISTPYGTSQLYNPQGNIGTSDIELERAAAIERSKWNRVGAQRAWI
jgi:hypothetical protein